MNQKPSVRNFCAFSEQKYFLCIMSSFCVKAISLFLSPVLFSFIALCLFAGLSVCRFVCLPVCPFVCVYHSLSIAFDGQFDLVF